MSADDNTQEPDHTNSSSVAMGEETLFNIFSNLSFEQTVKLEAGASSPFHGPKKSPWRFPVNCIRHIQSSPNYETIPESNEPDANLSDQLSLLESFKTQINDMSAEAALSDIGSDDSSFTNVSSPSASTSSLDYLEKYQYVGCVSSSETYTPSDHNDPGKLPSPELSSSFELPSAPSLSESSNLCGTGTSEGKAPDANSPGNENAEIANLESTNSVSVDEHVNERELMDFSQFIHAINAILESDFERLDPVVIDRNNVVWYTPTMYAPRLLMIPVEEPEPENLPFEI